MGNVIDIAAADGGRFSGYLSLPPAGRGAGLVLIQEIFGVNSHIRAVADDYAQQGYAVLAPDLFWRVQPGIELGYGPDDVKRGLDLRQRISQQQMLSDLEAAATALRGRTECSGKLGAVGYCMGGKLEFALAATPAIDVAISYYGAGTAGLLTLAPRIGIPIQFHYGALDQSIPPHEVDQVRAAFAGRGDVEVQVYAEAGHGFNCDQRDSYHAASAALARSRTLTFLSDHLSESTQ
jgi:carboxymethylenebutenolidase